MKTQSKISLAALCGVPLLMVLGNSMLIPILPKMKSTLDISQFQVSLAITLFSIPAGLTIPIAGFLADRIGRKAIIIPSLLIYGLGGLVAGGAAFLLNKPYLIIMSGRILQGIGAAGTAPIAMALSGDIFTSQERSKALGFIEASNGMGKVISPILGSIIGLIAWYAVLFAFPILVLPIAAAVYFLVKEPPLKSKEQSAKKYFSELKNIFKQKSIFLLTCFWAGGVVLFVLFGVLFFLSDHLETKYKIEGVLKGAILAIPVLAMSSSSFITGIVTQKKSIKRKPFVVAGLAILGGSLLLVAFFAEKTYFLMASLIVGGIGTGLVLTNLNTLITSSVVMAERGMVTSLYSAFRFFGVALGPPIFGIMMEKSTLLTFGSVGGLALATSGLVLILLKESQAKVKPSAEEAKEDKNKPQKSLRQRAFEVMTLQGILRPLMAKKPLAKDKAKEDKVTKENLKQIMNTGEFAGTKKQQKKQGKKNKEKPNNQESKDNQGNQDPQYTTLSEWAKKRKK